MKRWLDRQSDARLCAIASAVLFVLAAWPVFLVRVPPLQDLPAHLATVFVLEHPAAYPEFVATGFFKTNSALFAALYAAPESMLYGAGKACVLAVLFATAAIIPRFVLDLGGRARVAPATLAAIPLVHGWFVAMGMLDYAFAVALGLEWLRQASKPISRGRLAWMAILGAAIWWTHAFVVLVLALFLALDAMKKRALDARAGALAPAIALSAISFVAEVGRAGAGHGAVYRPPWETAYDLWAKHAWAFTTLEIGSLVSFVFLAVCLVRFAHDDVPLFGGFATATLFVLHFALPVEIHDWFAVNARLLPFLYACALVRVPERVPSWLAGALALAGISVSVGLGIDYMRLDRDLRELGAGTRAVAKGSAMFPLVFDPKGSSENTWALVNGWGVYVIERQTSAPLLFAHSPSFPLRYRAEPAPELHQLAIGGFAQRPHDAGEWRAFLRRIEAQNQTLLVWGAAPAEFAPLEHEETFHEGRLRILVRP